MKKTKPETTTSSVSEQVSVGQKRLRGTSESPEVSEDLEELASEFGESELSFDASNLDEQDEEVAADNPVQAEEQVEEPQIPFPEEKEQEAVKSDDSSDEEVLIRTGKIPSHWYNDYDHAGYSVKGEKVGKMKTNDEIEEFLRRQKDPEWW